MTDYQKGILISLRDALIYRYAIKFDIRKILKKKERKETTFSVHKQIDL